MSRKSRASESRPRPSQSLTLADIEAVAHVFGLSERDVLTMVASLGRSSALKKAG